VFAGVGRLSMVDFQIKIASFVKYEKIFSLLKAAGVNRLVP
jgi:hypothetical protein